MIGEAGDALPAGSVILKADFDTDKDLVAKYEVASQSTLVFLDENGAVVEKLLDPPMEKLAELFSGKESEATEEMGYYVPYSEEKMIALAGQKKAVFFHAEWCGNVPKMGKNDWGSGRRTASRVGNFES